MVSLIDTLLTLEKAGWDSLTRGEREFYQEHTAADALVVFPAPVGVITGDEMVSAINAGNPWSDYAISEPRIVEASSDSAILIYYVTAHRPGQPEYQALISSGYAQRDGQWKLVFHQHTPLAQG